MVARRFDTAGERELTRLYEEGLSQVVLARRFATSALTVRNTLHRAGAKMRRPGGRPKPLTDHQRKEIERCYPLGESQDQIARRLQTSQGKVSLYLKKVGLRTGRTGREGTKHPLWKGGRIRTTGGYVAVWAEPSDELAMEMASPNHGYVLEHRLVMARALGRSLEAAETVHHVNGDKTDNRLENLQLRGGRHGTGHTHLCDDCGSSNVRHARLG